MTLEELVNGGLEPNFRRIVMPGRRTAAEKRDASQRALRRTDNLRVSLTSDLRTSC
jgi:hypothetical protein